MEIRASFVFILCLPSLCTSTKDRCRVGATQWDQLVPTVNNMGVNAHVQHILWVENAIAAP